MMVERYIPAGRTSLVKKESGSLQLQTEYSYHPYPRITTAIQVSGKVLHKVEKRLEQEIGSIEEQQRMEDIMRRQHAEVEAIIRRQPDPLPTKVDTTMSDTTDSEPPEKSTRDILRDLPGVEHIYRLDNTGAFHTGAAGDTFKKLFGPVFKGLHELLLLFDELPGPGPRRRRGIYEVQRDRLYMISTGNECLFVTVKRVDRETDYEQVLREIAFGKWGPDFVNQEQSD